MSGMIEQCMTTANHILGIHERLMDVVVGDHPCSGVYVGDGVYMNVLTDVLPARLAFYDYAVASTPFFIVGGHTYHPIAGDEAEANYLWTFLGRGLRAMLLALVKAEAEVNAAPKDMWDWNNSHGIRIGMHFAWGLARYPAFGGKAVDATHADYFMDGEMTKATWSWDEDTKVIMVTFEPRIIDGKERILSITYDGVSLSNVSKEWGKYLIDGSIMDKTFGHIPFNPGWVSVDNNPQVVGIRQTLVG